MPPEGLCVLRNGDRTGPWLPPSSSVELLGREQWPERRLSCPHSLTGTFLAPREVVAPTPPLAVHGAPTCPEVGDRMLVPGDALWEVAATVANVCPGFLVRLCCGHTAVPLPLCRSLCLRESSPYHSSPHWVPIFLELTLDLSPWHRPGPHLPSRLSPGHEAQPSRAQTELEPNPS